MIATERIRALLDERGVEYVANDGEHVKETCWSYMGELTAAFAEYDNGTTRFACDTWCFTPEQAIAATLGRGTCRQEEYGWSTEGDHARVWLTCGHDCMVETVADLPNFCPVCGAKVVEPTTNDVDAEDGA